MFYDIDLSQSGLNQKYPKGRMRKDSDYVSHK